MKYKAHSGGAKKLRGGALLACALVVGYLAGGMHPVLGSVVAESARAHSYILS